MDAAVELVGTGGVHLLSHARVDRAAGIPAGSTSNHFRTRAALLQGLVARLVQIDREAFGGGQEPRTADELIEMLCAFVANSLGPGRVATTARMAVFVESMHDEEIRRALLGGRADVERRAVDIAEAMGLEEPAAAVNRLLGTCDGVILHGLALRRSPDPDETAGLLRAALTLDRRGGGGSARS